MFQNLVRWKAGQTGGVWGGPGGEASAGPDSWAPSGASHRIVLQKFRRTKCNYNFKIACMNIMNKNIMLNFLKLNQQKSGPVMSAQSHCGTKVEMSMRK